MTTTQDRSTDEANATDEPSDPSSSATNPVGHSQPGFELPDGEEPAATCERCARPFPTTMHHDLHLGEVHAEALTGRERERYEDALEAETDELFVYHLKVIAALAGMYAVLVLVYMVVLSL
ncbi:hypothetical protein [Haloarchaeobius iranensis]|uniref:C2H2-type domain-containing protein n=1 Tax=Haloarchaeobius iranensis TaxID=996166 RepID=A0A1G9W2R5_9EURY|nr:hypothetical protein [Haloarchaeobius iranensis]SDM78814.1 hypothetical protein SAMN05192554_107125 [Haloarchaeobius iranensis]